MRAFHFQKKQFWTPWICCRNYKPWFTTQTFKLALEAGERGERESSSKTVMLYYSHGRGEFWTQRRVFPRCRKEQKNQPWGNLSRETKKSFKNMEVGELALWDTSGRFGGGGGAAESQSNWWKQVARPNVFSKNNWEMYAVEKEIWIWFIKLPLAYLSHGSQKVAGF